MRGRTTVFPLSASLATALFPQDICGIVAGREQGSATGVPNGVNNSEPSEHLTTTEARGAATPHVTRYALGWGLALVILVFVLIFWLAG
jgi:hypothetical protein